MVRKTAAVMLSAVMLTVTSMTSMTSCGAVGGSDDPGSAVQDSSSQSGKVEKTKALTDEVKGIYSERYINALPVIEERMKEIVNIYAEGRFDDLEMYCAADITDETGAFIGNAAPDVIAADFQRRLKEYGIERVDGWDVPCVSEQPEGENITQLQLFGGQFEGDDEITAEYYFTTDGVLNGAMLSVRFQYSAESDGNISKGIAGSIIKAI